jgi:acyl carrier protein
MPSPSLSADEPLFGGRLPLDSVDSLQWAAAVERHFDIELTDAEIGNGALLTLGRMAQVLETRENTVPLLRTERA